MTYWPGTGEIQPKCPICRQSFGAQFQDLRQTHNTLLFLRTEYLPYKLWPDADLVILQEFNKGKNWVRAHVDCCFEIVERRDPAVTGSVTLRIVTKPAA